MAASLTITINIPACDKRAGELLYAQRAAVLAGAAARAAGGALTSGAIIYDGQNIGSWSYTPQAAS